MKELDKTFDPSTFEMRWYKAQEEAGFFRPEAAAPDAEPFTIVIPPPNVTGRLHVGHALGRTLEDVLCRWRRMQGRAVLWVPGVDHAGIATQMVVERDLKERTGKTRHDLGREAFLAICREWAGSRRGDILNQIRRLGASCDFTREYYTLDETRSKAVRHVFTTLYKQGLAYRAERMVNWCPSCATVLSDLEVNHVETSGHLWSIAYPVEGGGEVVVATTRPETMLGDTAVAVHPDDERYTALVGRRVTLPLTGRTIPVIADAFVDPKFGTGVVKVTPAHDPNDFEAGRRHGLELVTVIGFDGKMTKAAGDAYAGLDRAEARKKVLRDLDAQGRRRGEKSHLVPLARCQRCDTVVEPLVSIQWFVKIGPLAEKAVAATDTGETSFTPELWKKTYDEWMKNIRDWCVSRQLWWGHEIPAWYCADGHVNVPEPGAGDPASCGTCGKRELTRDPDVFDTWFSSWLMPLSVFGWPDETPDFKRFYPTSVLVTGFDILFFWVARMVMAGTWFDGRAPFKDVVLHGLVRDEKGQKMSKTKGNVVDPLEMCDEFGADAVRFTLAVLSGTGRDLPFGKGRVAGYRAFATKVWNATRFALPLIAEGECADPQAADFRALSTVDRWILARLSEAAGRVNASLEAYRFDEAAQALYQFFWSEFCDGYVEMIKPVLRGADVPEAGKAKTRGVLKRVLLDSLALLHPFMPFVSCEIREALNGDGLRLALARFPEPRPEWKDDAAVEAVETLRAVVTRVRNLRAENGLAQTEALAIGLELPEGPLSRELQRQVPLLSHLARLKAVKISSKVDIAGAFRDVVAGIGLVVELPKKEMSSEDEEKIRKEVEKLRAEAEKIRSRLADESFLSRAPASVVAKTKQQLEEISERIVRLSGNLVGDAGPVSGGAPLPPAGSPLGSLAPLGGRRFVRIHNVILLATAPSTNDFAKIIVEHALAESEEIRLTVIAAGEQTAGRGRAGRAWVPLPGALALSAIVPWPEGPGRVRLPIETGILLARGLSAAFGIDVRLKWPNDLLVDRRKLGGLLIEARSNDDGEGWAVIGIGLNVRGTRADLDARGLPGATSLEACGVAPTLLDGETPLDEMLAILDEGVGEPCADPLPEAFASVSAHAPGDLLTVTDGDRSHKGAFAGVTPEGFLRLATEGGDETLVSGDVVHF